jgi:hypothetical protein
VYLPLALGSFSMIVGLGSRGRIAMPTFAGEDAQRPSVSLVALKELLMMILVMMP